MLAIVTWLWGSNKFQADDVLRLRSAVERNLKQEHRFFCVVDRVMPELRDVACTLVWDIDLCRIKGCFPRLRMFDPAWQKAVGVDDRLVCIDLDTVITGSLDHLFDRPESFVIMQGGNSSNPNPYNGALMMLRAGEHSEVWGKFSVAEAQRAPYFAWPDDQGWIHHKLPGAAGWRCGVGHGVYVFHKPGWPSGDQLPVGARLVTFINNTPRKLQHLDWVKEHWR